MRRLFRTATQVGAKASALSKWAITPRPRQPFKASISKRLKVVASRSTKLVRAKSVAAAVVVAAVAAMVAAVAVVAAATAAAVAVAAGATNQLAQFRKRIAGPGISTNPGAFAFLGQSKDETVTSGAWSEA